MIWKSLIEQQNTNVKEDFIDERPTEILNHKEKSQDSYF